MLTVGDIIIAEAIDLDYLGQGVVKYEGYVIFVKGLIDHERAELKITKINKNFGEAQVIKILKKSEDRHDHHFNLGSLDLYHLSIDKQIQWQIKITEQTLKKIANIDFKVTHHISNEAHSHYRNKSVFHVMDNRVLKLGLYNDLSSKLVHVTDFILADHKTNEVLKTLDEHPVIIDPKVLKHFVFRTNQKEEVLITLVATKSKFTGLEELITCLSQVPNLKGITLNIKDHPKTILGRKSYTLYGENRITERVGAYDMIINDRSFFQVNFQVITQAYLYIKNHIIKNATIIDAYSGVGSIGVYLSSEAKKVIMIENNESAAKMAKMTIELNRLKSVEMILGNAEDQIKDLEGDVLIVDPPRSGLSNELLESIMLKNFKQIFYLSCDVKTLSKDLKTLTNTYDINDLIPIKMFYHTSEFETLVMLTRKA